LKVANNTFVTVPTCPEKYWKVLIFTSWLFRLWRVLN